MRLEDLAGGQLQAGRDQPVRVVIVEDHTLLRQSLVRLIDGEEGFEVVGQAGRGDEALFSIASGAPDVVLLDIAMPGESGLEIAEQLRAVAPELRLLFLSMHDDESTVSRAIALGAAGFLLKTASTDELVQALRVVAGGGSFLSPEIARRVMARAGKRSEPDALTDRELEILRLMAEGMRAAEIARTLFLSVKTVRNHLASIYVKLGVQTAAQAVAEGFRRELVAAPDRTRGTL